MRTVQEWREEIDRAPELRAWAQTQRAQQGQGRPTFGELLDEWIAEGHAQDFVKVTVIDTGETGFELVR